MADGERRNMQEAERIAKEFARLRACLARDAGLTHAEQKWLFGFTTRLIGILDIYRLQCVPSPGEELLAKAVVRSQTAGGS